MYLHTNLLLSLLYNYKQKKMLCGFFLYSLFHIKFCIPFIPILQTCMNWILFMSFLCIKSGIKRRLNKLFSQLIWNHDVTNSFSLLHIPPPAPALFCMYFLNVMEENPQNLRCTCSFESTNPISIISFMFCSTSVSSKSNEDTFSNPAMQWVVELVLGFLFGVTVIVLGHLF